MIAIDFRTALNLYALSWGGDRRQSRSRRRNKFLLWISYFLWFSWWPPRTLWHSQHHYKYKSTDLRCMGIIIYIWALVVLTGSLSWEQHYIMHVFAKQQTLNGTHICCWGVAWSNAQRCLVCGFHDAARYFHSFANAHTAIGTPTKKSIFYYRKG